MPTFAPQCQRSAALPCFTRESFLTREPYPPIDQFLDHLRSSADDEVDDLFLAETRTCFECIPHMESSGGRTDAMPPWAQFVFDSCDSFLVTTVTEPTSAALRANERPAIPLQMTRKSDSTG